MKNEAGNLGLVFLKGMLCTHNSVWGTHGCGLWKSIRMGLDKFLQ